MEKQKMIHIGEVIRQELKRQRLSAQWLAEQLNCDRTNVYNIFRRPTIDTSLLFRISIILQIDLFSRYSELINNK